jgi:hypothetical protein
MTDPLVEAAARAIAERWNSEGTVKDTYAALAEAVLAVVEPMIRADERGLCYLRDREPEGHRRRETND